MLKTFAHLFKLSIYFTLIVSFQSCSNLPKPHAQKPNIIFIMVDDMGYYDLGCYGSKTIKTPHIDKMCAEGLKFTQCYSGDTVCASARSTLMTGTHKGHTPVRGNSGGIPLFPSDVTIAEVLKKAGYATGGFGKWGLGNQGKPGAAENQGFDVFYGYYNQWHAHTYYTHLFHNSKKVNENKRYTQYSIFEESIKFIKANKEKPFFLYCPWTPPHSKYEIPESDESWQLYKDKPWSKEAKVAAAMDSMIDRHVGEILKILKEFNIDDKTIVFFTSDNGAAKRFDTVHHSCGKMQGHKRSLHEGGIRVPMIVRWPGKITAGSTSDFPWYFPDVMPTLAELASISNEVPQNIDGISIVPTLLGKGQQKQHEYMFWDFRNMRAVRQGPWKVLRKGNKIFLFDISKDLAEKNDLSQKYPDILKKLSPYLTSAYKEPRSQKDDGKYSGLD